MRAFCALLVVVLVLHISGDAFAATLDARLKLARLKRSHSALQAAKVKVVPDITGFRLSFFFAPGYCHGLAGNCHANLKAGAVPKRAFFLHGMWEMPGQNNGFADAINARTPPQNGQPSAADVKPGMRLKDWYTIPGSGINSQQASHAIPPGGHNADVAQIQDAEFIAVQLDALGAPDPAVIGARGNFVQTHAANDLMLHEVAKHGFYFQRKLCSQCPGPWGSAKGYVEAASALTAIWKPKMDALAAHIPAGKYAAGQAGLLALFNAGAGGAPGLGKQAAVLCPGGGVNTVQEVQLCFSGFPKNAQAGSMAGTNSPNLLVDCALADSNCAANNIQMQ